MLAMLASPTSEVAILVGAQVALVLYCMTCFVHRTIGTGMAWDVVHFCMATLLSQTVGRGFRSRIS